MIIREEMDRQKVAIENKTLRLRMLKKGIRDTDHRMLSTARGRRASLPGKFLTLRSSEMGLPAF